MEYQSPSFLKPIQTHLSIVLILMIVQDVQNTGNLQAYSIFLYLFFGLQTNCWILNGCQLYLVYLFQFTFCRYSHCVPDDCTILGIVRNGYQEYLSLLLALCFVVSFLSLLLWILKKKRIIGESHLSIIVWMIDRWDLQGIYIGLAREEKKSPSAVSLQRKGEC